MTRRRTPRRVAAAALIGGVLGVMCAIVGGIPGLGPDVMAVLAQDGCVTDQEPNDAETDLTTTSASGAICIRGSLPENDQDLFLWELTPDEARAAWTLTLDGVAGTLTGLQLRHIDSDPGAIPVVVGAQLLTVESQHDALAPTVLADVFLPPGRYLLGISRSPAASGGIPISVDYAFSIVPASALPPSGDTEPNDVADQASPLTGAFDITGDLSGSYDVYGWTVPEPLDGEGAWTLSGTGVTGGYLQLTLQGPDGSVLLYLSADASNRLIVPDLRLAAGRYLVTLSGGGDDASPYRLASAIAPLGGDAEPNDGREQALALALERPIIRGKLGREGDGDYYRINIAPDAVPVMRDIRLIFDPGPRRELCLETADGVSLQCRGGTNGAALRGLLLLPGEYLLAISGEVGPSDRYLLRIDPTGAPAADFETEPNDVPTLATPFDASMVMHARGASGDRDHYLLSVSGKPQLWEVSVTGTGIDQMAWLLADGTYLAAGDVAPDHTGALLTDVFLIPGQHVFSVSASEAEYAITARPLGPPDPNAEREPNNDAVRAEPYRIGATRLGRLPGPSDADVVRFSLSATEHVVVRVESPPDGQIDLDLDSAGRRIGERTAAERGGVITYDALLLPGDYELWLRPTEPSLERYRLTVERADPFLLAVDQEPNEGVSRAGTFPTGGVLDGQGGSRGDEDWFRLPPSDDGAPVEVDLEGDLSRLLLSDGTTEAAFARAEGTRMWTVLPPSLDVALYLIVRTDGDAPYRIRRAGISGEPVAPPTAAFSLELQADRDTVAAYWPDGQQVNARLRITNEGQATLALALDVHTTHFAWSAEPDTAAVDVPPTSSISIPVAIRTLPDAWADDTVRITIRVRDGDGATRTAHVDLTPDRDAAPASPSPAWPIPEALLGGLDVASTALGAEPVGAIDPALEAQLHDGITHVGIGWWLARSEWALPVELTVDLAGDQPVMVVGTMLDPQALDALQAEVPRRFSLLLSPDGSAWQEALAGELSTVMGEQPFVLDAPVAARFARLRIDSSYGSPVDDRLVLGEWKVVAAPGTDPDADPANLADPRLGGHLTWHDPMQGDPYFPDGPLSEDPTPQTVSLVGGSTMTWVVGFREDRAAQVTELQWVDPPGIDPAAAFRQLELAVSLQGPAGPWRPLGPWKLQRAGDGSVAALVLPEPVWARFVRYTAVGPREDAYAWPMPATLRILERAADDEYRSILAEWGAGSSAGPYELLEESPAPVAAEDSPDGNDTLDAAQVLTAGEPVRGRVDRGGDVDWYSVAVPEGDNTLTIRLRGRPVLAVALTLVDREGLEVPMLFAPGAAAGVIEYSAEVVPGATYRVRVEQPVSSVVLTYDTSLSLANYTPLVFEGMRAFSADVVPGEEEVLVMPFEEEPLLDHWSDQPYELQNAINGYVPVGLSSGAEAALIDASDALSTREGARAVLLVTDAETSTASQNLELWGALGSVRPLVFAAHIGAQGTPLLSEQLMQDWTRASGGFYQYARSHGELDRTFDRLATWLRRPAAYELAWETAFRDEPPPSREPGTLSVVPPPGEAGDALSAISPDVGIEIILDTSGSMLDGIGGQRRIDLARSVLADLVENRIPAGAPVAVRVFGSRDEPCGTRLVVPLGPLVPSDVRARVGDLEVDREADTPIGAAISAVPGDLSGSAGTKIVLLITDSEEIWPHDDLCGLDPAVAIRDLRRHGVDARLNIVGMAVTQKRAKQQMRRWARSGGGGYFDARGQDQLSKAIERAVSAPFRVYDEAGNEVAGGTVGGDPVPLPPGRYSVVVLADPPARFDAVVVRPDEAITLTLPIPADRVPSEGSAPMP